ncbi:MAG TPA: serine hydrolase domain-containing protein [Terracidiphilus sp.]|jgi:CubicO group peptidase (beta-lactamase class C family)|nr:serine hydrolase domain-containing protein [Terracidiphilus sp.]
MMESELSSPPADVRSRFAPVYDVLNGAIAAHAFPGCAFGVFAHGNVVLEDALGRFTYDDEAKAVTPTTIYDLASLTKVVATTAATMLLHQKGLLELDTPLGDLLPGFVVGRTSTERARHVKLRHLLAHNSGLPGYAELFRTAASTAALIAACQQLPLEAEPGRRAEYSDPGFILLGKALEILTGEDLAALVRSAILKPLDLSATGFTPPLDSQPFIPPTEEDISFRHRRIQGEVQDENAWVMQGVAGHAGLFSNVADLLRFASQILAALHPTERSDGPTLFAPETVRTFAERQGPEGSTRTLGWDTPSPESSAGRYFSAKSIGHLGYSGCSLWIDLEAGVAIVLLTNRTWPDRKNLAIRGVRPAFHDAVREALLPANR